MSERKQHLTIRLSPDVLQIVQVRATTPECAAARSPQTTALEMIVRESVGIESVPRPEAEELREIRRYLATQFEAAGVDTGKLTALDLAKKAWMRGDRATREERRETRTKGPRGWLPETEQRLRLSETLPAASRGILPIGSELDTSEVSECAHPARFRVGSGVYYKCTACGEWPNGKGEKK